MQRVLAVGALAALCSVAASSATRTRQPRDWRRDAREARARRGIPQPDSELRDNNNNIPVINRVQRRAVHMDDTCRACRMVMHHVERGIVRTVRKMERQHAAQEELTQATRGVSQRQRSFRLKRAAYIEERVSDACRFASFAVDPPLQRKCEQMLEKHDESLVQLLSEWEEFQNIGEMAAEFCHVQLKACPRDMNWQQLRTVQQLASPLQSEGATVTRRGDSIVDRMARSLEEARVSSISGRNPDFLVSFRRPGSKFDALIRTVLRHVGVSAASPLVQREVDLSAEGEDSATPEQLVLFPASSKHPTAVLVSRASALGASEDVQSIREHIARGLAAHGHGHDAEGQTSKT